MNRRDVLLILGLFVYVSCIMSCRGGSEEQTIEEKKIRTEMKSIEIDELLAGEDRALAVFAGGCFWCTEVMYEGVAGVVAVVSGYSGGKAETADYKIVSAGKSEHVECVAIVYDKSVLTYKILVDSFWNAHDPTSTNGQAPDFGKQYQAVIFYQNDAERQIAETSRAEYEKKYAVEIKTKILPLQKFFPAEAYHQDFATRNPNHPYVVNIARKKLAKFRRKTQLKQSKDAE